MVSELTPGDHEVVLSGHGHGPPYVSIQAGDRRRSSCRWPRCRPPWFQAGLGEGSFTVEIREQGRLLGTTDTDRVMMAPAGTSSNSSTTRSATAKRTIQVAPGKVTAMPLTRRKAS